MPRTEGSPYDQLNASLDSALHAIYAWVPITEDTRRRFELCGKRTTTSLRFEDLIREEVGRVRFFLVKDTIFPVLWQTIMSELTTVLGTHQRTLQLRDLGAERYAESLGAALRELCLDRRSNPADRLVSLLEGYRLSHLEHLEEYVRFRTQQHESRTIGSITELDQVRADAFRAIGSRNLGPYTAEFLLSRIDYLIDARHLQLHHPTLWEEWIHP